MFHYVFNVLYTAYASTYCDENDAVTFVDEGEHYRLISQMYVNSLDVSAPGHFPWLLDWTYYVGLLYVMFRFPTRIFYMGVPGFATDCPCGVCAAD